MLPLSRLRHLAQFVMKSNCLMGLICQIFFHPSRGPYVVHFSDGWGFSFDLCHLCTWRSLQRCNSSPFGTSSKLSIHQLHEFRDISRIHWIREKEASRHLNIKPIPWFKACKIYSDIQVNSADDSCGQLLRWHPMTLRFRRSMWSLRKTRAEGELQIWLRQDLLDHRKLRKSFSLYIDKYHNSPNLHHTMFHQLWKMYHLYHLHHPFHDTSDMWMVQHIYNHHNPPGRVGCNFPAADAMDSSDWTCSRTPRSLSRIER